MRNGERLSLEQIRTFLAASEESRFEANNREEIYGWVTKTLVEQEYGGQKREGKGLLRNGCDFTTRIANCDKYVGNS